MKKAGNNPDVQQYDESKQNCSISTPWNIIRSRNEEKMLHAAAWMNFKTIMLSAKKSSPRIPHYGITPFI